MPLHVGLPLRALLQDQAARTVLEKHLPAAMGHPMFSSVGDLSL
jgi:hypothetical protein